MGCGQTSGLDNGKDQNKLAGGGRQQKKHDKKEVQLIYLFGVNEKNVPTIFSFNAESLTFSNKKIPMDMVIGNYCSATYVSPRQIFITGGLKPEKNELMSNFYCYDPTQDAIRSLGPLIKPRYAHTSIFINSKLYVIGGKTIGVDEEGLLDHVERFDLEGDKWETGKWEAVSKMTKKRCTCFSIIYRRVIYIFGGYTGLLKRSRKIERYLERLNQWEVLNFKLHRGVECGLILSNKANEIILLGGQIRSGPTKSIVTYDFVNETVQFKGQLTTPRVLQKGLEFKEAFYIFGGDSTELIEITDTKNWEWHEIKTVGSFTDFVGVNQIEKFSQSIVPLVVEYDPSLKAKITPVMKQAGNANLQNRNEIFYLFGSDNEPFIFEFNVTKSSFQNLPVPLSISLYAYQGGARITADEYFLAGGIQDQMDMISKKSFYFNTKLQLHKPSQRLNDMNHERYAFNCVFRQKKVYAIGGRSYGEDNVALLKECERFDSENNSWERIAELNNERCSAMSFLMKEKIYIAGGYKGNGVRCDSIESYDEQNNIWTLLTLKLKDPVESAIVEVIDQETFIILGGRSSNGDTSKLWLFNVNTNKVNEKGNLKISRSLHKFWRFKSQRNLGYSDFALVIGGGEEAQSIDLFSFKSITYEEPSEKLGKMIEDFKFEIEMALGIMDLKKYILL